MMKKFSHKTRSYAASVMGLLTALATAYAVIDFSTFDIKKDWFRLIVVGLPVVGGFMSSINQKDKGESK